MTEQRKSLIKLIAAVVIILLLPVLFFRFIGDDPGKQKINATRQIAVVNEDMGLQTDENEEEESVHFGKEVAAALGGVRIIHGRLSTGARQKTVWRLRSMTPSFTFHPIFQKTS